MSVRVHELAKELKLTSKDILDKFKSLKMDVKSHMSVLTDDQVKAVKSSLKKPQASATKPTAAAKPAAATKTAAPPPPARPAAPSVSPSSSIENVKREFLLQRLGAKAAVEARKPSVPQTPARKPAMYTAPAKPKVLHDAKKLRPAEPVKSVAPAPVAEPAKAKKIEIEAAITVKDLAAKVFLKPNDLIQRLIKINIFASINQSINFEIAAKVVSELGYEIEKPKEAAVQVETTPATIVDKALLRNRAPIVTFMGHVDHGKTSLLDAIRKTKVAAKEAGGITQHIGAYEVFLSKGAVTFLDTPGHEAFTAMRARGAGVTDVVVLVVAADDGVMPQTVEAIDHAKAADVPIIVAINKTDLPSAQPDRVKKGLMEHGLTPEDWGGKTIMVPVSAKTGKGIDELLEMLALESDLLELKANPTGPASGTVVEAELSQGSGVLATLLVQDGTLHVGDVIVIGNFYCKVRAMINDRGQRVKEAPPSMPVEILGCPSVPQAGDRFYVVKDERKAKDIIEKLDGQRARGASQMAHVTLEHLLEDIKAGTVQELKLILKSDVQGSVEALRSTLGKIESKNVRFNIIHSGSGEISESDVMLAAASNAVVIGFHVGINDTAKETAEREGVDVRFYDIIYEAKTAIEMAMEGLLTPELKEVFVGMAEVRQIFKVSKVGTIAGCMVQKGKITRNAPCRVVRGGQKIKDGKIESLKRFKDDAREVLEGFECGIGVANFDELLPGDRIEVYEIQKKARKLE